MIVNNYNRRVRCFTSYTVPAQTITHRISPTDIAATIATYLGVEFPSDSISNPLYELGYTR